MERPASLASWIEKAGAFIRSRGEVVLILLAGAFYKSLPIFFPRVHGYCFDSDQAVTALMALHFVRSGRFALFYYGQSFGGGLEYLATCLMFVLLPPSVLAHRLGQLGLNVGLEIIFYGLACRIFEDRCRRSLSLLLFVFLASTYQADLTGVQLSNLFLGLAILYLFSRSESLLDLPALKGLAIGLGLWVSQAIALFLVPALVVGLARRSATKAMSARSTATAAAILLFCCLLGCAPRLYYLWEPGSWYAGYEGGGYEFGGWSTIRFRAEMLFSFILPTYFYAGLLDTSLARVARVGVLPIAFAVLYSTFIVAREILGGNRRYWVHAGLLLLFWMTLAAVLTNAQVYDSGARYLFPLQPFFAVSLTALLPQNRPGQRGGTSQDGLRRVGRALATSLAVFLMSLAILSTVLRDSTECTSRTRTIQEIIRAMEDRGVHRGYADYWIAYDVSFRTNERIKLAPFYTKRIQAYEEEMRAPGEKAYVFLVSAPDLPYDRETLEINAREYALLRGSWGLRGSRIEQIPLGRYLLVIETPPEAG